MTWIYVEERRPAPGQPVLVWVDSGRTGDNCGYVLRAQHAGDKTLEMSPECDGGTFDEETNTYWCEPGWYETNQFEEIHWAITDKVLAWMPLPLKPTRVT